MPFAAAISGVRKGRAELHPPCWPYCPVQPPHPAPHAPALVLPPARAPRVLMKHPGSKTGCLPGAEGRVFLASNERYFSTKAALQVMVPTNICTGRYPHLFVYARWFRGAEQNKINPSALPKTLLVPKTIDGADEGP